MGALITNAVVAEDDPYDWVPSKFAMTLYSPASGAVHT